LEKEKCDEPETLGDVLRITASEFSSNSAVNYGKNVWSYRELDEMVQSLSASINNAFPVKKGQRVLVILPQSMQNILAYFSLWNLGLCPIPVDSKMPVEILNKIVSSGKISGLITYSDLFSQINRDDTASLYTLLTDSLEFRSSFSGRNPDMEGKRKRGSLQRPRMEEMCYGESGDMVKIDTITDAALSNIGWNQDGSFTFIDFNHATVINALKIATHTFPMVDNIPYIVTKEPMYSWEVVLSILLPVYRRARFIMCENPRENLEKCIDKNCMDESWGIWTSNKTFKFLEGMKPILRDKLTIIYRNTIDSNIEPTFLGKRITSLFSLSGHELAVLPIFLKQYLRDGAFKLPEGVNISPDTFHPEISGSISAEGYQNENGTLELRDVTYKEGSLEFSNNGLRGSNYFNGFSIPVQPLEKWLKEFFNTQELSIQGNPSK
jgi:Acyl-CoA synthetases (AMP-forming)/AMP-acid ligases II